MLLMRALPVCLMTILIAGCANFSDGCGWVEKIIISNSDSLTRSTKEQIVTHNIAVEEFCR